MARNQFVTLEKIRDLLEYNPESGLFVWRKTRNGKAVAGQIAGWKDWKGYIIITIDRVDYRAHQLAWLYMTGEWAPKDIDHKNRVKDDNRFINLRPATRSQNNINSKLSKRNTTGHKGVTWDKKRNQWAVYSRQDGKHKFLGRYASKEEAIQTYRFFMIEQHGEFAEQYQ